MLKIKNIDCYYGNIEILKRINLSADIGEFIGIIGPNGSGKTTLLKCISRVLKPKVGSVILDGNDIYGMKALELAKKLSVVSQDTKIDFEFNALEIVLMGRTPHLGRFELESGKDLKIAKNAMEVTNTLSLVDRPITEISGGERQRVIIARALAQEPKILLLDEPTSNLDINYRLEILDLIKRLTIEQGLIAIMAIHDLNMAANYCDYMTLLHRGEIISKGGPKEVLTAENIRRAYRIDAIVKRHPMTNSLYITPLSTKVKLIPKKSAKIHIISGAGTGSHLMNLLSYEGYQLTAGVLNVLDTDHETAKSLDISIVSEAPFSPISKETHKANLNLIAKTDVVVLTCPPFGEGNRLNLDASKKALENDIPLFIVEDTQELSYNYENEDTKRYLKKLIVSGAKIVQGPQEILEIIRERFK